MSQKIGFIGLGLIGGSIAKAIRQYYPDDKIVAYNRSKEPLALATREMVIDVACARIDDNFKDCDYIFLCTPVARNNELLKQLVGYVHKDLIITDVGSVKSGIHNAVKESGLEPYFIGGHPMAGSERTGYSASKATILENAFYVLTPTEEVPREKIDRYYRLVEGIHAIPILLECGLHDHITGTISHLPHLIASSLVNFVKDTDTKDELMKNLAAGGFKDITRIASSSPDMWESICVENKENISTILGQYIESLIKTKAMVDAADGQGIYDMFEKSRNYRNAIPEVSAGPIKKAYAMCLDVEDEAGVIAIIATILAANAINIKNIGIINNREFEEGALRIEFYDADSLKKAIGLLEKRYIIYER